jgi:hypothetical protein
LTIAGVRRKTSFNGEELLAFGTFPNDRRAPAIELSLVHLVRRAEVEGMPAKKELISGADCAKRIREGAVQEVGTDNDPASFERAFGRVVTPT